MAPDVAAALQPGTEGRFYGYKAIDHRGLFAMRTRDGRSAFKIPSGNERIMLMAAVVGAVGFVVLLLLGKGIGLLALAMAVLGGIGYFKYRSTRIEGRARYDSEFGIYPKLRLVRSSRRKPGPRGDLSRRLFRPGSRLSPG